MRKVVVKGQTSLSSDKLWSLITDLNNYPKHVKFLKKIEFEKPLSLGSKFSDITTIAFVPLKVVHTVDVFEENKRLGFFVQMPVKGFMKQTVNILSRKGKSEVELSVDFDFQNAIFELVFGTFLERRIKEMLLYILESGKTFENAK